VYLAVILDAWSRRAIGWQLGESLDASLTVQALEMALRERSWRPGVLVHHSDRGVQYAAGQYVKLLQEREILISMSRKGNPYDNAKAERFMRTLKEEEVNGKQYRDLAEARAQIAEFLEQIYNRQRLHSALRYLTPAEFEEQEEAEGGEPGPAPLPRHGEKE
jgi:transposase InsO family protein